MNNDLPNYPAMKAPFRILNGPVIDAAKPPKEAWTVERVAHVLAKVNRFGGHTIVPYSVATHSVLVCRLCPPELAYEGLMHDVTEAMGLVDMPSGVKKVLGGYKELEAAQRKVAAKVFGLKSKEPKVVKELDTAAFWMERALLQGVSDDQPSMPDEWWDHALDLVREWNWRESTTLFQAEYERVKP